MSTTSENNLYYTKKQVSELISGDIILHPIFRSDGLMLVNKEKQLSTSLISMVRRQVPAGTLVLVAPSQEALQSFYACKTMDKEQFIIDLKQVTTELNKLNTVSVYIKDAEITDNLPETATADSPSTFQGSNDFFSNLLSNYPLWLQLDSRLESEPLKQRARQVKKELLAAMNTNRTFIILFDKIRSYDDVLLIHSINTMCIALMIGLTLELSSSELMDLSIAALFCNVGFVEIEKKEFLYFLKNYEHIQNQIKRHLEVFSEMTASFPELRKKDIVFGILDHHEYYNGLGCPNGKKGNEISLFGRILFIAHSYDELVGGYNFKVGLHPLDALRIVYENIDNRYDPNILDIFIHRTTYFKLGEMISLPNIQRGVIIGFDDFIKAPHLPIIRLESGHVINLATS